MKMKKILFIRRTPDTLGDGTANYCLALADLLADDADVRALPMRELRQKPSLFKYRYDEAELSAAIAEADIVHINGYTAMGTVQALRMAKRQGKRVIYSAHWHPFETLRHPLAARLFFNLFVRPAIKRYADEVLTINRDDTTFFRAFHPRVTMIPHWQKKGQTYPSVSRSPRMILFVGRLNDPMKGSEYVMRLPEGQYDIHCVGNGVLPTRSDVTHHVGISASTLDELYAQASLVVVPSRYEAFSYVAMEALCAGTPVLMSDRVRIADHLPADAGHTIFPYGDSEAFVRLVPSSMEKVVDVGCIRAIFSAEHAVEQYKMIYLKEQ